MIHWTWLFITFPVGWFMFFLGVAMASNKNRYETKGEESGIRKIY